MNDLVTLTIDGVEVTVPKGTVVVDAAKRADNDIPVFCYHPKMKPVGMCRMCLVEIGMPVRDRATGELVTNEDGTPKINFGKGLQTGCTVQVADGMVVRTKTEVVTEARDDIIEFLLTSHPLDCPICDKGGECPLQNLTMRHGPGTSRFDYEQKMHMAKHVPLGDLIYLDRERCIQCGRCTRFQDEIAGDPVISFHNRGRRLEIVTLSEPGFDSYWSGNTTDICPVGALTTADFRFGARPWELTPVASICPHCPVGCNTTMSTRQEAKSDGRTVIKRIMPRQNEAVNEIWICDKGRFVHHFADSPERLTKPLIRKGGLFEETSWDEALSFVAKQLETAGSAAAGLVGDQLSNEDLFLFQKLFRQGLKSNHLDLANNRLGGGDAVAKVGISAGSNLKELGSGDAILVVASDLHEEAPVWWLRVKQAAERGAAVVVLNLRPTRLDQYAAYTLPYRAGNTLQAVRQLLNAAKVDTGNGLTDDLHKAADTVINAENLVAFYGHEGLSYEETETLAHLLANFLLLKSEGSHAGKQNSGLIPVWPGGNTQGAWDMGLRPDLGPGYTAVEVPGLDANGIYNSIFNGEVKALYLLGADPVGDGLIADRGQLDFLVVQDMFLTES
ncbi:MAG: molybdopterin-dependent oxidoreductase, partial [Candidatus Promineifilaceae bacterium]